MATIPVTTLLQTAAAVATSPLTTQGAMIIRAPVNGTAQAAPTGRRSAELNFRASHLVQSLENRPNANAANAVISTPSPKKQPSCSSTCIEFEPSGSPIATLKPPARHN